MKSRGYKNIKGEWFLCNVNDVKSAIKSIASGGIDFDGRLFDFGMRPEQKKAVKVTSEYFKKSNKSKNRTPKFLWNAKMRFGKTFTTYQLANVMGWKKILVLTFKPAVQNA